MRFRWVSTDNTEAAVTSTGESLKRNGLQNTPRVAWVSCKATQRMRWKKKQAETFIFSSIRICLLFTGAKVIKQRESLYWRCKYTWDASKSSWGRREKQCAWLIRSSILYNVTATYKQSARLIKPPHLLNRKCIYGSVNGIQGPVVVLLSCHLFKKYIQYFLCKMLVQTTQNRKTEEKTSEGIDSCGQYTKKKKISEVTCVLSTGTNCMNL